MGAGKRLGREGIVDLGGGWRRRGRAGKREIFRAGLAAHPAAPTFVRIYMLATAGDVFERCRALNDRLMWAEFYNVAYADGRGTTLPPSGYACHLPAPREARGRRKPGAGSGSWASIKKRVCG